eukprot:TRINITY_DN3415_c0_g1_i1.p1 TRINITY_DN3415_c0_g1~~TRINITY_DN3415_c0_g1_i1.p1  ORF type:complete len:190 (+),score=53.83 TRINITY_DN3415_c0_g1_i1:47-616(+)
MHRMPGLEFFGLCALSFFAPPVVIIIKRLDCKPDVAGAIWDVIICTIVTLLGWLPGVVYALATVIKEEFKSNDAIVVYDEDDEIEMQANPERAHSDSTHTDSMDRDTTESDSDEPFSRSDANGHSVSRSNDDNDESDSNEDEDEDESDSDSNEDEDDSNEDEDEDDSNEDEDESDSGFVDSHRDISYSS